MWIFFKSCQLSFLSSGLLEPAFFSLALLAAKLHRRLLEKAPLLEFPKQSFFLNTAFQNLERLFYIIAVNFNFEQFTYTTLLNQKTKALGESPMQTNLSHLRTQALTRKPIV